jgi:YXWGXW repeat-containing protein
MLKSSRLVRSLSLAALMSATACVAGVRPRAGVIYVSRQPPVERVEVISVRPGAAHVWIGGHWDWRESDFIWIGGRWEEPRPGYRTWVPGRWAHDRNGWYFIEGHWR